LPYVYKHNTPDGVQDIVSSYTHEANIFCSIVLWKSGLRIYLKLNYAGLENPPEYARDVSNVGHWGVGDVELAANNLETLEGAKAFVRRSFGESKFARRS
jgi:predicted transport protein